MKEVKVRQLVLGWGNPKICVPITGKNREEICRQAELAVDAEPDLIEWRVDFFTKSGEKEEIKKISEMLRKMVKEIPVIFTVRTQEEGGEALMTEKMYRELLFYAAELPEVDLIDVEIMKQGIDIEKLIREIQKKGKKVIMSNHHFEGTPGQNDMRNILTDMDLAGGDIRKLAVMPKSPADVIALMQVTEEAGRGEHPVISMSMGDMGKITRMAGMLTGSCVTFASVGKISAPGQMNIHELRKLMKILE